jgi:P-type Cu+ transporter
MKTGAGETSPDHAHLAAAADTVRAERVHSHDQHVDVQRVSIEVTSGGYVPGAILLERGLPAELVFTRTTGSGCAAEVHIPELGVAKTALPQDEAVTVRFTPEKAGTFAFLCGMDMLRGTLIVE